MSLRLFKYHVLEIRLSRQKLRIVRKMSLDRNARMTLEEKPSFEFVVVASCVFFNPRFDNIIRSRPFSFWRQTHRQTAAINDQFWWCCRSGDWTKEATTKEFTSTCFRTTNKLERTSLDRAKLYKEYFQLQLLGETRRRNSEWPRKSAEISL